jgi:hypothetical protein
MTDILHLVNLFEEVLTPIEETEFPEPKFDFSSPENVIIEVILLDPNGTKDWNNCSIETINIIDTTDGVAGAASYDAEYGGFLDYTIQSMIDCPGEGWFTVVGVTGVYTKGDGWMTDDDMTFDYKEVRPATQEEISVA